MLSAEELHERGVAAINSGRVRSAGRFLRSARDRTDDPDLRSRIDASLAYVVADLGDPDAALTICDDALGQRGLAHETLGVIQSQRALLLMRRGETASALTAFEDAIEALQTVPAELGRAELNRGGVHLQQGSAILAARDFAAAATHLRQAELAEEAAKAQHNLGYTYLLTGDLVAALTQMKQASRVLAPLSPVARAIGEADRAEVLLAAGLTGEGQAALREAARAYGLRRLHQRRAEAELTLARSLLLTDPSGALTAARAARDRFSRVGSDAWRDRSEAVVIAAEVEVGRSGPGLLRRADAAAIRLLELGLDEGSRLMELHASRVLIRRGDLIQAAERVRSVPTGQGSLNLRLLARLARVELHRARGQRSRALDDVRRGLDELHRWQSTFNSLDLQTSVVARGYRLAGHGLELALEKGDPAVVLEWSERARTLASRVVSVRPPVDSEASADLAELRQLTSGGIELERSAARRADELRQRIRERAWGQSGSGEVAEAISLADMQAALGPDTALVAHIAAGGSMSALVVTDTDATVVPVAARKDVAALVRGLVPDLEMSATELGTMSGAVRRGLLARLAACEAAVVAPVLSSIGDRSLVLTPSAALAGMPWTLLPSLVGRPITVAASATTWHADRGPWQVGRAGFVAGPGLQHAGAEVEAAARVWDSARGAGQATLLTGASATTEAVARVAREVDVLHLSAHGRHSADNPLFSGVELADGPWFGYDIDRLERVPSVIVLSSCEVGRSSVRSGEELIGMTTAWLHAGARCVIASSAAVNDAQADHTLREFVGRLAEGVSPARALAHALPTVDEHTPPAPFVCFGGGL